MTELDAGNDKSKKYKREAIWKSKVLQESQRVIYYSSTIWFLKKVI